MAGYLFLPIPTPEMVEFANTFNLGRTEKGKQPFAILRNSARGGLKGVRRGLGLGVLRGVTRQDKLYVLGHGQQEGSRTIGAYRDVKKVNGSWEGPELDKKAYSPMELAFVLSKEGLMKQFIDLRVFACGSANTPAETPYSYAKGLWIEMRNIGYYSIEVSGYQGSVKPSHVTRLLPNGNNYYDEGHKGVQIGYSWYRAKDFRVKFDDSGD